MENLRLFEIFRLRERNGYSKVSVRIPQKGTAAGNGGAANGWSARISMQMHGCGCGSEVGPVLAIGMHYHRATTGSRKKKVSETQRHPEDRTLKKEIVMKRTINAIALFVASMFITAGVWAQSVKATIPFDFTVNNTTVPSGTYIISSASTDHDVLCISDQKHVHLLTSALPNPAHAGKANVMVFHKYGNQYFLSEIRSADSSSMNLRLPVWKAEKRARMQTQETAAAAGPFSSDVMVALY
jgi:hypothetical protein